MTPPPRARDERYDRQVRLWGDVGQSRLERASVCALGVTPATCEATSGSKVLVELGNDGIKGMCTNDFIVAAKIDACEEAKALIVKEAPKARNWF